MGVPSPKDEDMVLGASMAMGMGVVTGILFQVPNEHTTFAADPLQMSRTEGAILAYCWSLYLDDPTNPEWIAEFAMTKVLSAFI